MGKAGRPEGLSPATQRELAIACALWELWHHDGGSRTWCARAACDLLARAGRAHLSDGKLKGLVRKMDALGAAYWTERLYAPNSYAKARGEYGFIRGSKALIFLLLAATSRHDAEECGRGLLEVGWDRPTVERLLGFARALNVRSGEYDIVFGLSSASKSFRAWLTEHESALPI